MNADVEKADEIMTALRRCVSRDCKSCGYQGCGIACKYRLMQDASDLIDNLTAQLAASLRREKAAVVLREGENPDGTIRCVCPTCGRLFQEEAFVDSYCPDCGQRLILSSSQETREG